MLLYGTGFDWMPTTYPVGSSRGIFGQLGYYGFPGGSAPTSPQINTNGRFSGKAMTLVGSSVSGRTVQMSYLLPGVTTPKTWYQGSAMYVPSGSDILGMFIGIGNNGTALITVAFKAFGVIELWLGREWYPLGTKLASSPGGTYRTDVWNFVEVGGLLDATSAGHVEVRLNTKTVISVVSTITQPTNLALNSYMFGYNNDVGAGQDQTGCYWDDVYLCDNTTVKNNTFLGNIRVRAQLPAGPGANTQFAIHGVQPTNWQAASNLAIDDTSYVYDNVIGDFDLYTLTPIANSPQVFGVFVLGAYRQTDATQRSASNLIQSNGIPQAGSEFFTPGSYAFSIDCFENDPSTSLPWLYTAVNLLQIGPLIGTYQLLDIGDGSHLNVGGTSRLKVS